ncbi:hypothetical protein J1N35_010394 [Gossypium stocksii]|uniref:Reverse transcriptase zinc-binding domain-containing protein n=1 Tax=Gossypium stocksii TaxID=47602 RepID=A0A9D3VZX6_9ROSI|nr:hypothetical protein J1N35_010394 [Gossypium stocksii]
MEKDGFSPSVTYKNLFSWVSDDAVIWKMIWRVSAPQRIRVILWLLWHDRLLENNREDRQRFMLFEITLLLRLYGMVSWNLQDKGNLHCEGMEWQTLFVILCWLLWKSRNECVFSNSHKNIGAIVDTDYMWARSYRDLDVQMKSLGTMRSLSSWIPSVIGWIKLNSNRAVSNLEQRAFIRGVLRDSNGNWLWGYAMSFSNESPPASVMNLLGRDRNMSIYFDYGFI